LGGRIAGAVRATVQKEDSCRKKGNAIRLGGDGNLISSNERIGPLNIYWETEYTKQGKDVEKVGSQRDELQAGGSIKRWVQDRGYCGPGEGVILDV